jgi:hypothetical protein
MPSRPDPMPTQPPVKGERETESFPEVKRPVLGADHLPYSSAVVATGWGYTLPPLCACIAMLYGDLYLYS